jgi:DNA repair exonuclease SbcCD ATPase subunit
LNQQLVDLRKQYKSLSAAERDSAKGQQLKDKINQLDTELKKIDASTGQFQRNVGNYPKTFAMINRSLTRAIPGFEAFSAQLKDSEGRLNLFGKALIGGFVAFQAAKLIGQAIKRLDEFITKINETKQTVAEFSGAYGQDLDNITAQTTALAETFDTDAKTISEAAQKLGSSLGIGFEEALGKLEGALVEGQGNAGDYLKTIADYPQAFQAASGGVTEFSERNKDLLQTNKELAQSQVDVARRLQGVNDSFKEAGKQIETGLFLVFAKLIEIFRPVGQAFSKLGQTLQNLFAVFNKGGKETSIFTKAINILVFPIELIANQLVLLANGISYVVAGFADFINQSPLLKSVFDTIISSVAAVYEGFRNLPAVFSGIVSSLKQLGTNFVNFFQSLYLDAQIFGQQVKGVFGANVQDAINELRRQKNAINADGATIAEAFSKGYNDAKKKADEQREKDEKEAQAKRKKVDVDALKAQQEAAKTAAEKLRQDRKKYAEDEIKAAREKAALLLELQTRLQEETIKNIKNNQEREIKEIELNAKLQLEALKKQYDDLKIAQQEREKELAETFGKNSPELLKARQDNAKQLEEVSNVQAQIEIQIEQNKVNKKKEINDTYSKEELEKAEANLEQLKQWRDEALTSELNFIEEAGDMRLLKNEETLNKQLAQEKDAKKRELLVRLAEEKKILDEIEKLKIQLRAVDDQEEYLKDQAAKGVQIRQEEYDAVAKARQDLNTKLSAAELQYVDMVQKNSDDLKKKRLEDIEEIAGYVQQGLELLDTVLSAISARAEKNIEEQLQRSSERQDKLNEELQTATGLRRQFLQQQIDAEIKNEEMLAKKQEEIQRKAAKREKAIAVTQSIIQGFLAISKAVASAPPPANIPAIITASIQSAIQTAGILAQPLAEGGAVTPVGLPDSGGKVVGVQNIPQTTKGDNVLVAARVGETFLNAKQTKLLRPVLSAARIPGFANGGLLGAPNLGGLDNGLVRAFNDRTNAISGQVMESKVYLVTDELHRDTKEGERIKRKVTLR